MAKHEKGEELKGAPSTAAASEPAPPTGEAPRPKSDAIPDDVEKLVTWGAVGGALAAAALGFIESEHGPKTVLDLGGEALGWTKEGFSELADDTSPATDLVVGTKPAVDAFTARQELATKREDERRRQQTTGLGFFVRIFNPLPLAMTTHCNGDPEPTPVLPVRRPRGRRYPWSR